MPLQRPDPKALLELGLQLIRDTTDEAQLRLLAAYASFIRANARLERIARFKKAVRPPPERNISPKEAAKRLGISVRKLTRGRFTTYREICVPIAGQTRGYVVSEPALASLLQRQRSA